MTVCPYCAETIPSGLDVCPICRSDLAEAPVRAGSAASRQHDAMTRMLIPVDRSGWAVAAGYAGLVSLFCLVTAPLAIILGVVALRDLKRHPEQHGKGRAIFGIAAGVVAFFGLVAAIVAALLTE